ncbi:hypothetical protein FRC04_009054 [Tulasnella sp. 424]|nr:hypothetical protein FRC04_009054 [Tulasnella sp. 424]
MSPVSNATWGNQAQVLPTPAPAPSICTITLANGVSVPASALHNEPTTQDSPLSDTSYTAHIDIIPLSPSNHEQLEHIDENTIWRWMGIPPLPRAPSSPQPSSLQTSCSSTAIPVPLPTPLSQGSPTRRKRTAAPKNPSSRRLVFVNQNGERDPHSFNLYAVLKISSSSPDVVFLAS